MNGPTSDDKEMRENAASEEACVQKGLPSSTRRTLLKAGASALPVAMTLHSGAVQAMASISCGKKAYDSNLTAPVICDHDDGWMRQTVPVYDCVKSYTSGWGGYTKTYTSNTGTPAYYCGSNGGTPVWRNHPDGTMVSSSSCDSSGKPKDCGQPVYTANCRALVQCDATTGQIVAVGAPCGTVHNGIITSVAGNCMHSLAMHKA